MAIQGIEQPAVINIDDNLRLRKYDDDCAFALEWYQDKETVWLVDGDEKLYDMELLYRMYHYLADHGEAYFIEIKTEDGTYGPIGDVTFWQEDMPIVIGRKEYRGKGIGGKVVRALIERGKSLGFPYLAVEEIYDFNIGSRTLFERAGFVQQAKTKKGHSYRLEL